MGKTNQIFTGFALLIVLCLVGAAGAQAPQSEKAEYEKWGFSVGVPPSADKISFQVDGDTLLSDVYVKDNLAYQIKITSITSDLLTPTEIEKAIQAVVSTNNESEVVRWELETKEKRLFKGYNHDVTFDQETLGRMPYLQNILPDGKGVESVAMAQVTDDTSPILSVSVIGPKDKAMDVATRAKFTVYTVESLKKSGEEKKSPTPNVEPGPVVKPPKTKPQLGKGDIELTGMIESLGKDGKSIVLLVDHIRLPDQPPAALDPARPKTVVFNQKPEDLKVGTKLLVIGKNQGVGKPIIPLYTESLESVKPGKRATAPPAP